MVEEIRHWNMTKWIIPMAQFARTIVVVVVLGGGRGGDLTILVRSREG